MIDEATGGNSYIRKRTDIYIYIIDMHPCKGIDIYIHVHICSFALRHICSLMLNDSSGGSLHKRLGPW